MVSRSEKRIEVDDDNRCFVCGKGNDRGLQLEFIYNKQEDRAEATVRFPPHYQGWQGIVHGGLIGTVLDEIQVKAASFKNINCVTAELSIKYRKPMKTETQYQLFGKIIRESGRLLFTEGEIRDECDVLIASATAKLFIIP